MIASITKTSNYKTVIAYHEDKIKSEKGSIIHDSIGRSKVNKDFVKEFDDFFLRFEKGNMKNKIAHISISLPIGEHLTDDQFNEIAKEYLNKMGYGYCPNVIYRHEDKSHDHIHILVSTIDFEGKKTKEYNDFKRSENISRKIEIKFKLKVTESKNLSANASLTEINFRKYYLHNAIKKASHGYNTKAFISIFFSDDEKKQLFVKEALTQRQILSILGQDRFDTLYVRMKKQGYLNPLFKDEIAQKLEIILKKSTTLKDYITQCNKQGIYARVIYGKDKNPFFKYGLLDNNVYFKDSNLSARFRFINVMKSMGYEEGKNLKSFSHSEQFDFISKSIENARKTTGNFEAFNKELTKSGIEPIYVEGGEGVYNVKFRNCKASTPVIFDCLDFGISFQDLKKEFNDPKIDIITSFDTGLYENYVYEKVDSPIESSPVRSPKQRKHEDEDELLSGSKKKKGMRK